MPASPVKGESSPGDPKRGSSRCLAVRRDVQGLSIQISGPPQLRPLQDQFSAIDGKPVIPRRPPRRRIKKMDGNEKIYDHFSWKDVIQEDGDGGKVVVCRKKTDDTEEHNYVLKIRTKDSIDSLQDQEEFRRMLVKMLNIPPHNGVIPYLEVLEDDTHFYCVMEKAAGGSLLSFLVTKHADGCVPEAELKEVMRQILQAVGHVHKQGMIHRDIKPDNIVIRKIDDSSSPSNGKVDCVTLIDFDHAETNYTPFTPSPRSENIWGTTGYNAPETYLGHFSPSSDLFSIGVTLYMLMTGKMPYDVKALKKEIEPDSPQVLEYVHARRKGSNWVSQDWCTRVFDKMLAAEIDWSCDPWPQNEACRSFCQSLLAFKPQRRPASVEEALQHTWLADTPRPCRSPSLSESLEAAVTKKAQSGEQSLSQSHSRPSSSLATQNTPSRPSSSATQRKNVANIIEAMKNVDRDDRRVQPVQPLVNDDIDTKLEEEEAALSAVPPEEIEVEQEMAVDQSKAPAANSVAQHKAMLQNNELQRPNNDLAYKISPSKPLHRRVLSERRQRFKSCEHPMASEHPVVRERPSSEQAAGEATAFSSRPSRRQRFLGLEGLRSQLSPLTPSQTPQPSQPFAAVMPSARSSRERRHSSSSRPGRTVSAACAGAASTLAHAAHKWMRSGSRDPPTLPPSSAWGAPSSR